MAHDIILTTVIHVHVLTILGVETTCFVQVVNTKIRFTQVILNHDNYCSELLANSFPYELQYPLVQILSESVSDRVFFITNIHVLHWECDHNVPHRNELFLLSIITAVQKVMENLSLFLSPYLQDIVTQVKVLGHHTRILVLPAVHLRWIILVTV